MLGYVTATEAGGTDALFADVAGRLHAAGVVVAGAVQVTRTEGGRRRMSLRDLRTGRSIPISQDLGRDATGCSLDPAGLEEAVGLVDAALRTGPMPGLVIVNKYGKQEVDGRGFRSVIGMALAEGIPVLISVSEGRSAAFRDFAGELAEPVPADLGAILDWVGHHPGS